MNKYCNKCIDHCYFMLPHKTLF